MGCYGHYRLEASTIDECLRCSSILLILHSSEVTPWFQLFEMCNMRLMSNTHKRCKLCLWWCCCDDPPGGSSNYKRHLHDHVCMCFILFYSISFHFVLFLFCFLFLLKQFCFRKMYTFHAQEWLVLKFDIVKNDTKCKK